jgi:hypothetical protein
MDSERRKHSNETVPENVERPARGPRRRTRDSGALPDLNDSRKRRGDDTKGRRQPRHPRSATS